MGRRMRRFCAGAFLLASASVPASASMKWTNWEAYLNPPKWVPPPGAPGAPGTASPSPSAEAPIATPVARDVTVADNVGLWQINAGDCAAPKLALDGMGVPYTLNTLNAGPNSDAELTEADGTGKYSLLVICSDRLAYASAGQYPSALTDAQWAQFENYQVRYGVRRVTFGVWPAPPMGVNYPPFGTCCSADTHGSVEQYVTLTPQAMTLASLSGINPSAKLSTIGISHYPTTLYSGTTYSNFGTAVPIIEFGPTPLVFNTAASWVGGVVTTYPNLREDMNFFMSFGSWSPDSMVLQHLWIQWGLRSCYPGFRRAYLTAQVDDVFLASPVTVNHSAPASPYLWDLQATTGYEFRIAAEDVLIHQAWQKTINAKLPAGSKFTLEFIFNGNGVLLAADAEQAIATADTPEVPNSLHFKKPLGTGVNAWPDTPTCFNWSPDLLLKDALYAAFQTVPSLKSDFFWVQHTFTHMELNNATYSDTAKEISFDKAFAGPGIFGLEGRSYYSPNSLVPPAITGLFNGDALRAFKDTGIYYVCGDNTRPELVNTASSFHALRTTVADNGFDGIVVIPRFATSIYYNVSTFAEEEYLFNTIYFNSPAVRGTWKEIYALEVARVTLQTLSLHPDAYMFHQANMRAKDITQAVQPYFPVGKFSLLMLWVEMVTENLRNLVNWPIVSRPMQEMVQIFLDREIRDSCGVKVSKLIKDDQLIGVQVIGGKKKCTWPISVPGSVKGRNTISAWKFEQLSPVDPLTVWVPTKPNQMQTILLDPPVPWVVS